MRKARRLALCSAKAIFGAIGAVVETQLIARDLRMSAGESTAPSLCCTHGRRPLRFDRSARCHRAPNNHPFRAPAAGGIGFRPRGPKLNTLAPVDRTWRLGRRRPVRRIALGRSRVGRWIADRRQRFVTWTRSVRLHGVSPRPLGLERWSTHNGPEGCGRGWRNVGGVRRAPSRRGSRAALPAVPATV